MVIGIFTEPPATSNVAGVSSPSHRILQQVSSPIVFPVIYGFMEGDDMSCGSKCKSCKRHLVVGWSYRDVGWVCWQGAQRRCQRQKVRRAGWSIKQQWLCTCNFVLEMSVFPGFFLTLKSGIPSIFAFEMSNKGYNRLPLCEGQLTTRPNIIKKWVLVMQHRHWTWGANTMKHICTLKWWELVGSTEVHSTHFE